MLKPLKFCLLFILSLCVALLALGLPVSVSAIEVQDLYQDSVIISNQSRQARTTAQRDVFRKVLIKVSGSRKVLEHTEIKTAVNRVNRYLNQYRFSRNVQNQAVIEASFDEGKVNRLLRVNGLPIWGKRRPSILLWMAAEHIDTQNRQAISKDLYPQQLQLIEQLSKDRGLPIILPLYDLQDNKAVSVSDIWGYFFDHIKQSSSRYKSDAIIISRLWPEPADKTPLIAATSLPGVGVLANEAPAVNWQLEWRLYEKGQLVAMESRHGTPGKLFKALINTTADRYAAEYAVDALDLDNATRIVLTVTNVAQVSDLINAEKLLISFSAVSDVLLKRFKGDSAEFEVALVGELLDLVQGLALETHFEKIYDPLAEHSAEQPLELRWVR